MAHPRVSTRAARGLRAIRAGLMAFALASLAIAAGCGDLAGADIHLASTALGADFGTQAGSIPPLACSAASASACSGVPAPAGVSGWQVGCDTSAGQCFGQADLRIQQTVTAADPSSFDSAVGKQAVHYLESIDIAYTIPTNTLTFALAKIQLYVVQNPITGSGGSGAPEGGVVVEQAPASSPPGDVLVGNVAPLAAGQVVGAERHLSLDGSDPAFTTISSQVEAGQDLVLALVVTPRVVASGRLPAGAIQVVCAPTLHFGLTLVGYILIPSREVYASPDECRCDRARRGHPARDRPAEQRREHVAHGVGQRILRRVGKHRGDQVLEDVLSQLPADRDRQQRAQSQAQQAQDGADRGMRQRVGIDEGVVDLAGMCRALVRGPQAPGKRCRQTAPHTNKVVPQACSGKIGPRECPAAGARGSRAPGRLRRAVARSSAAR